MIVETKFLPPGNLNSSFQLSATLKSCLKTSFGLSDNQLSRFRPNSQIVVLCSIGNREKNAFAFSTSAEGGGQLVTRCNVHTKSREAWVSGGASYYMPRSGEGKALWRKYLKRHQSILGENERNTKFFLKKYD
jgi:hypothetical protein